MKASSLPRLDSYNILLQYYIITLHPIIHEKIQQLVGKEQNPHCLHLFTSSASSFLKYTWKKKITQTVADALEYGIFALYAWTSELLYRVFIMWRGCLVQGVQGCERKQTLNCVTAVICSIPAALTSKETLSVSLVSPHMHLHAHAHTHTHTET